jgi:hypothetical protein
MIKRATNFIEVAFFLSKYGKSNPPEVLQTTSWKVAYRMFYEKLNEGRDILTFEHSLKNARDAFDSHFTETQRKGWKDGKGLPNKLSGASLNVFKKFNALKETEVWQRISDFADKDSKNYEVVFENLLAVEESEKGESTVKTEGGIKVYISSKVERNPSLRNDAFNIHGYDCMVCGFNFEEKYGIWGKDWAEVHHLKPIAERKDRKTITNPKTDLVVLCANCHRMIHRKKDIALSLTELMGKINK